MTQSALLTAMTPKNLNTWYKEAIKKTTEFQNLALTFKQLLAEVWECWGNDFHSTSQWLTGIYLGTDCIQDAFNALFNYKTFCYKGGNTSLTVLDQKRRLSRKQIFREVQWLVWGHLSAGKWQCWGSNSSILMTKSMHFAPSVTPELQKHISLGPWRSLD